MKLRHFSLCIVRMLSSRHHDCNYYQYNRMKVCSVQCLRTFASPPILLINLFDVQTLSQMKFGSLPSSVLRHFSYVNSTKKSIRRLISIGIKDLP
jgi:hypothetical protein